MSVCLLQSGGSKVLAAPRWCLVALYSIARRELRIACVDHRRGGKGGVPLGFRYALSWGLRDLPQLWMQLWGQLWAAFLLRLRARDSELVQCRSENKASSGANECRQRLVIIQLRDFWEIYEKTSALENVDRPPGFEMW